ncbi:hypothetical protein Leryth_002191 [Lithospermum erythrorhizon]|nr:hypothetical protein Leryth_002191 [Lithospermum erythrorhizon]
MPIITKLYSMEEASQHNTKDDCWIVIHGKVYDVSSYLDEHPGGDDVLLEATGRDATDEFEDAGHSKSARELMAQYCIGELDTPSPVIPELDVVLQKEEQDIIHKCMEFTRQYYVVPVAIAGIAVLAAFLFLRKK